MANIHRKIEKLYITGLTDGIDFEEYKKVEKYNRELRGCNADTIREMHEISHSLELLNKIVAQVSNTGLNKKYYGANYQYIINNASLLLLSLYELAMSKYGEVEVGLVSKNSVFMPCTLDGNKSSAFVVSDINNRFKCYSCSREGTNIDFLSTKHRNLSTNQVIEAICHLYGYEVPDQTEESVALAEQIRDVLATDLRALYKKVLEDLRDTLIIDNKTLTFGGRNVDDIYDKKIADVDRIIARKPDPNFTYNEPPKKIILQP